MVGIMMENSIKNIYYLINLIALNLTHCITQSTTNIKLTVAKTNPTQILNKDIEFN